MASQTSTTPIFQPKIIPISLMVLLVKNIIKNLFIKNIFMANKTPD
jgi:hypothetical protein